MPESGFPRCLEQLSLRLQTGRLGPVVSSPVARERGFPFGHIRPPTQMTHFCTTQDGQVTTDSIPNSGTYALNGTAVTFTFDSDGSTGTGSLSGNTLTVVAAGLALIH
jgi:hypothetical protein